MLESLITWSNLHKFFPIAEKIHAQNLWLLALQARGCKYCEGNLQEMVSTRVQEPAEENVAAYSYEWYWGVSWGIEILSKKDFQEEEKQILNLLYNSWLAKEDMEED